MKDHKNHRNRGRRRHNDRINNENKISEIIMEETGDKDSSAFEPEYEVKKWYEEVSVHFTRRNSKAYGGRNYKLGFIL